MATIDMTYAEKLRDPRWQQKRLEVLERDKWSCVVCGRRDKELHVHHGYYEYGKEPWDYATRTLHTICDECHEIATMRLRELKYELGCVNPRLYEWVRVALPRHHVFPEDHIAAKLKVNA